VETDQGEMKVMNKALVLMVVLLFFLVSCKAPEKTEIYQARKSILPDISSDKDPNPEEQDWFIDSYYKGVITVHHAGNTYIATCRGRTSYFWRNDVYESKTSPDCGNAIDLVQREVASFEGERKRDADGRFVFFLNVGTRLVLRSTKDESSPLNDEEFEITSVAKK
jgi:hypothetical protein